jgi:XPG N-terminal domain
MGVKDLWTILEPIKRPMSLHELQGQIIAVDLSIWIVEAKTLQWKGVAKPHLR